MPGELGVGEAGALADLLLVDGDPLADIAILQDRNALRMVMKDGCPRTGPGVATPTFLRSSPVCRARRPPRANAQWARTA